MLGIAQQMNIPPPPSRDSSTPRIRANPSKERVARSFAEITPDSGLQFGHRHGSAKQPERLVRGRGLPRR